MAPIDERLLNVNAHGVLSVPLPMWLGLIYLGRQWLLGLAALGSIFAGQDSAIFAVAAGFNFVLLLAELPVALVLWSAFNRHPMHPNFAEVVWKKSLLLITVTICLHLAYFIFFWIDDMRLVLRSTFSFGFQVLLDIAIGLSFWRDAVVREVLAEYPPNPPTP